MMNGRTHHPHIDGAEHSRSNGHHQVYSLNDYPDLVLVIQSDGLRCLHPMRSHVDIPGKAEYMHALSIYHHHVLEETGIKTDIVAYGRRGLEKYLDPAVVEQYAQTASIRRRLQIPRWTSSVTCRLGGKLWERYKQGEYEAGTDTLPEGMGFLSSLPYPVVLTRMPDGIATEEPSPSIAREISSAFTVLQHAYRDRDMEIAAMRVPCGFEQGVALYLSADIGNPFDTIVFVAGSIESGCPQRNLASTLQGLVRKMEAEGQPAEIPFDTARDVADGMPTYFLEVTGMTLEEFSSANLR
ncbi:MAG: hypothetical protein HGB18_00760 [Candidatus Moranbacteria bacterium]|nr:hypothetical protein [Candidatus Moranbacteria bacterium]